MELVPSVRLLLDNVEFGLSLVYPQFPRELYHRNTVLCSAS